MKSRDETFGEMMAAGRRVGRRIWIVAFSILALLGIGAFLVGISGSEPQRAWMAYMTNFVFWSGLAFGSVLLSATLTITEASWGRPIKRLAEAPVAFLPVAFVLFWVLYLGKELIFPWILHPVPEKASWLNADFMFLRDGLSLLVLIGLSVLLVYHSVKADQEAIAGSGGKWPESAHRNEGHMRAQAVLAPVMAIAYALVLSLIAFDLIMSLSPHWYSTLFGAYYFIGSFYTGLVAIMVLSIVTVRGMDAGEIIMGKQLMDLAKLTFAFCICTGDFFYCQFLVIWYGNIPEETRYVILRAWLAPWNRLAWTVLITAFVAPFIILLRKKLKTNATAMLGVSVLILTGMWLERYLLVVPSIWKGETIPMGIMEFLVTVGYLGIMGLCLIFFFNRFPMFPVADPYFNEVMEERRAEGI